MNEPKIVKVGIQFKETRVLKKIDLTLPARLLLEEVLGPQENIDDFAFRSDRELTGGTYYVTDESKVSIKNGYFLEVKPAPKRRAEKILSCLSGTGSEIKGAFQCIYLDSDDFEILKSLVGLNADRPIFNVLEKTQDPQTWVAGLKFFHAAYTGSLIPEIPQYIIETVMRLHDQPDMPINLVTMSLRLIAAIRRTGNLPLDEKFIKQVMKYLEWKDRDVQTAALRVLNYTVLFAEAKFYGIVYALVINDFVTSKIRHHLLVGAMSSQELQCQLYIYQSLLLFKYKEKATKRVKNSKKVLEKLQDESESAVVYKIQPEETELLSRRKQKEEHNLEQPLFKLKLSQSLNFLDKVHHDGDYERKRCFSLTTEEHLLNNIEFRFPGSIEHFKNSVLTIRERDVPVTATKSEYLLKRKRKATTSLLTAESLEYFSYSHKIDFSCWFRSREKPRKSLDVAEQISQAICEIFEIGRFPKVDRQNHLKYQPIVFTAHPKFFGEFFAIVAIFYDRIEREMNPKTHSDASKVIYVVKYLLRQFLKPKPNDITTLEENLKAATYILYQSLETKERKDKLKQDLKAIPIFLECRSSKVREITSLVEEQRIHFMIKSGHLPMVTNRGMKQQENYIHLSYIPSQKCLMYGITGQKRCTENCVGLRNKIKLDSIVKVTTGRESLFSREILQTTLMERDAFFRPNHIKPLVCNIDFIFSIETNDGQVHNFSTNSQRDFDYWTDGLNVLFNKPLESDSSKREIEELLDMEVRLQFLEIEGLPVPKEPPPVPPPPSDFLFFSKRKRYEAKQLQRYKQEMVPAMSTLPDPKDYCQHLRQQVKKMNLF